MRSIYGNVLWKRQNQKQPPVQVIVKIRKIEQ
jgi:hypothetical protein